MANLFDYLKWRGDLSFEQAPFNDIDSLILARLSYLPLDGIAPSAIEGEITVASASEKFYQWDEAKESVIMKADFQLLREVAASERFAKMVLCGYSNQVDLKAEKQFAAMAIRISPLLCYISFRGTDLTLAGWKEDFNMSFCTPVPSQTEAVRYLNKVAQALPGKFIVGGHSKGGNLAVYASSFCESQVQNRIISIYNNDGPGFDASVLDSSGYMRIADKIRTFIPQSSVVGMLLQHEEDYYVIHSKQRGLMQHDIYSWEVDKTQLVYLDEVTDQSKFLDHTLKTWLKALSPEDREQFVDTLFSIFEATDATTLKELTMNWHQNARTLLRSVRDMDEDMRQNISKALGLLLDAARKNVPKPKFLTKKP